MVGDCVHTIGLIKDVSHATIDGEKLGTEEDHRYKALFTLRRLSAICNAEERSTNFNEACSERIVALSTFASLAERCGMLVWKDSMHFLLTFRKKKVESLEQIRNLLRINIENATPWRKQSLIPVGVQRLHNYYQTTCDPRVEQVGHQEPYPRP